MAIPANQTPSAPTRLSSARGAVKEVNLIWNAPVSNGGSVITGYEVEAEKDGVPQGFSLIPNSDADTIHYNFDRGRQGNLFTVNAEAPGSINDTGLRVAFTRPGVLRNPATTRDRITVVSSPREPVLGFTGADARWLNTAQFRLGSLRIDLTNVATGRSTIGGVVGPQDLPEDAEQNFAFAMQIQEDRFVFGPFYLRDDMTEITGGTPAITGDEPYSLPYPGETSFESFRGFFESATNKNIRVIIYDPRRAGVTGIPTDVSSTGFEFNAGLQFNSVYRFRVRAINAIGKGAPSEWTDPITIGVLPEPEKNVVADINQIVLWPDKTTSLPFTY